MEIISVHVLVCTYFTWYNYFIFSPFISWWSVIFTTRYNGVIFSQDIFIVLMMSWRSWKIFRWRSVTLGATIDCSMPARRIPLGVSLWRRGSCLKDQGLVSSVMHGRCMKESVSAAWSVIYCAGYVHVSKIVSRESWLLVRLFGIH